MFSLNVISKEENKSKNAIADLKGYGLSITNKPDIVLCLGDFGTLFRAENKFPAIPKVLIKDQEICKNEEDEKFKKIIEKIIEKKYKINEYPKLEADNLVGMNDIIIRNRDPGTALKFTVKIDNRYIIRELIGDGIVIATPFGATGYFNSITRKKFSKGFGIAFNNPIKRAKPVYAGTESTISLAVNDGIALVCADNCKDIIELSSGKSISIKRNDKNAKIIALK
ncbi:MAG: hypothetical protein PHG05_04230 [Candidatus Nanoarchaeia archaeon]|nr:hypothetical protein [Candidatus Nanoarchaeia archaeon]